MGLGVAARSFRNLRKDRRRAGGRRQAGEWTRSKQHSPSRDDPKRCHQLWGLRATSPFCQHEFAEAAIQHRSTAVRTAYHVPMMYQGAIVATMDWLYPLSGFVVGAIVGLTGMGGGSLMTPLLILLFGVHPLTAVGTDLLYAAVTKTAGTAIHSKKGNVDWRVYARRILVLLYAARFGVGLLEALAVINPHLGVQRRVFML